MVKFFALCFECLGHESCWCSSLSKVPLERHVFQGFLLPESSFLMRCLNDVRAIFLACVLSALGTNTAFLFPLGKMYQIPDHTFHANMFFRKMLRTNSNENSSNNNKTNCTKYSSNLRYINYPSFIVSCFWGRRPLNPAMHKASDIGPHGMWRCLSFSYRGTCRCRRPSPRGKKAALF